MCTTTSHHNLIRPPTPSLAWIKQLLPALLTYHFWERTSRWPIREGWDNTRPPVNERKKREGKEGWEIQCIASTAALTASVLLCQEEDIPPGSFFLGERRPVMVCVSEWKYERHEMTENGNDGE